MCFKKEPWKRLVQLEDKIQFVRLNTKTEHRKTDRWPAPCAYSQRSFLSPKAKKVYRNDKRESPFLRLVILCNDLREAFWENRTIVAAQRWWAICHTSEISFPGLLSVPYWKLQRLFAVIHLSPPCNRISEKVDLFGVTNRQTIGIWFCVRKSYFVIFGYVRKRH